MIILEKNMLINCKKAQTRINYLVHKYNELIVYGAKKENILVITLNAYKKSLFQKAIQNANVYTFQGLCYNAFLK